MPEDVTRRSPFDPFLERHGVAILDGGLGSRLEAHGADLNDPLWSARVILDDPDVLEAVHREYLEAGADCIATVTYQATVPGLVARGLSRREAIRAIERAVDLAVDVRDAWWAQCADQERLRPLVAASIGPYGAYLANGAEYTGDYDLDDEGLLAFHADRWNVLATGRADLLALETMPSMRELGVLVRLLEATPTRHAWVSLSCRDARRLADGTPLGDVVRMLDAAPGMVAIGANCFEPQLAAGLVDALRAHTTLPVAVYPNSGERYDAGRKTWAGASDAAAFADACTGWRARGASILGGCCRTGPEVIRAMRSALIGP